MSAKIYAAHHLALACILATAWLVGRMAYSWPDTEEGWKFVPRQAAAPGSAPTPPLVSIAADSGRILLTWQHADLDTAVYEVRRSEDPFFDPKAGEGDRIDLYHFAPQVYGIGEAFGYADDGTCGRYVAPLSAPQTCRFPQGPPAQVTGDSIHNYTWIVLAGGEGNQLDFAARVGEFDFQLEN